MAFFSIRQLAISLLLVTPQVFIRVYAADVTQSFPVPPSAAPKVRTWFAGPTSEAWTKQTEDQLIGLGYETSLGDAVQNRCVELKPKTPRLGMPVPAPKTHVTVEVVSTGDEMSSASATSVKAELESLAPGAGSGGSQFIKTYAGSFTSFNSNALNRVSIIYPNQSYSVDKFQLSNYAKGLLKSSGGLAAFRVMCGDQFVIGFNYGAELSAILSAEAHTEKEQRDNTSFFQAAKAGFDASILENETYKRLREKSLLRVDVVRNGLEENLPAKANFEEWLKYGAQLPEKVAEAREKKALPVVRVITATYFPLLEEHARSHPKQDVEVTTPSWIALLARQYRYLLELYRYRNDIQYLITHPEEFIIINMPNANTKLTAVNDEIVAVQTWALQCVVTNGKTCSDQSANNLRTPQRIQRATEWAYLDSTRETISHVLTNGTTEALVWEASGSYKYGRSRWECHPITWATQVQLRDQGTNALRAEVIPAPPYLSVPPNTTVWFRVIESKSVNYTDNGPCPVVGPDAQIRARLGGDPGGFLL